MLTDKQVQNAIGLPPKSHTPNLQLKPIVSCKWETSSDLFGASVAFGPKDKYPMDRQFADTRTWAGIDGIGDRMVQGTSDFEMFLVSAGGYNFQVTVNPQETDEEIAAPDKTASKEKYKQAGILVTKNVLASFGIGKGDDGSIAVATPSATKTSTSAPGTTATETMESEQSAETETSTSESGG